jgi:ADP-heptose:LPS heptosyltransferase
MKRRFLFVIRGKLGDTLIAYALLSDYAARHRHDEMTLLVRKNYLPLLAHERGIRLVTFGSRAEMIAKLLALRTMRPIFDALAVLWGFGRPMVWIARLVRARRKIYLNSTLAEHFPEFPTPAEDEYQIDPAWRVLRCLDPELPRMQALHMPGLAALRQAPGRAVGLVPFASEPRRDFDPASVAVLAREIALRHPGDPVWIIVNPADARRLGAPPPGAELVTFSTLGELIGRYAQLKAWYGTDTGPYHLAVAMGIPATTFFGPTQPLKNSFPRQPALARVRLAVLGNNHCEEKRCERPLCLHQAVANFSRATCATLMDETPSGCPLRTHAAELLGRNA